MKNKYNNKNKLVIITYKNINLNLDLKSYNRILKQIIIKPKYDLDLIIWCLIYRYRGLGYLGSMFGSIHPKQYEYLHTKNNMEVEGFGSFLNHTLKYYFGLFYDLEKYFGCLGNFYNGIFMKGIFLINPPYITEHINDSIKHALKQTENNKVSFLFSLPIWDIKTRKLLNIKCSRKEMPTNYKTDMKISLLNKSKYLVFKYIYCKEDFVYYDYLNEKNVNFADTYIIFVSSENNRNKYDFDCFPKKYLMM